MTGVAVAMKVSVYCTKLNPKSGVVCGALLAHVDIERWEMDMASEAELVCQRCRNKYKLRDYLG